MTIKIVGADYGPERDAAETLKEILEPRIGNHGHLLIVVSARCLGENTQDIDLLLLGTFGGGLPFKGKLGDACGKTIRLVNLALLIEVKDHSSDRVCIDSQHIRVLYKRGWHDATDQLRNTPFKRSANNRARLILRCGATRSRIVECIKEVKNTRHVSAGPYAGVLPLRC